MTSLLRRSCLTLALVSAVLFAGCATRGYQRAEATSNSMEAAATDMARTQAQISLATSTLSAMLNQPQQDLRPAFNDFSRAVANLQERYADLENRSNELAQRRDAYLTTWDQRNAEIQNPDIRDASLARQRQVTEDFARAQQAYQNARQTLQPLVSDLQDVQRLLSVDLTANGIATVRELALNARNRAESARQTLDQVASEFRAVSSTLDPQSEALTE